MWVANFLVAASATMVTPFLSLYIETFGQFSDAYVQRWSGFIFGVTFLVAFIVSPLWGRFGDKHGRKKILLVNGFGIATGLFLMGYVSSVYELFTLRAFQGVVTGFISTSLAFVSAQTPKRIAGQTLGTLQTGTVSGALFGPLIGGGLADAVGFEYTFVLTSGVIAAAATLVAVGVKELSVETATEKKTTYSKKEVFRFIFRSPVLFAVMFISMSIQVANFSIQPLLALYVSELGEFENVAFLAGIAFSATGLGNLLATRKWGRLGDRIGYEKVLLLLLLLAAVFFIPQAFVTSVWQLAILRFLFGISLGGIIPCLTAYIRLVSPATIQGEVLGYHVSFRFLGNVIGPVMGGMVAGFSGISSVFFVTSFICLASAGLLWSTMHRQEKRRAEVGEK
jgi:DHA1 family multidrug resistance protein-like MFS transporter